jgi:transcriptional regulator with XRE-family HTH domain
VPKDALRNAISSHVARLLKVEREKAGISLNALAQKSGLSRQTVSYVEQEAQSPSLDTLLRLTLALEIELADVIKRATKAASPTRK